ncbi:nuclear receptor-interacting protein 1 [Osmerus mordax]|uniref:nuclear receptor-interacting protein 1 n=1 Tax=Osmerus mordax TaxID=8014 RepID=UPI00350FBBEF
MTHGEEPGPETHTDSAVLTYLEGLLMHPVAAGPGATATRRSEAANGNQEQVNKAARPFQLPHGPSAPKPGNGPSLGSSQNLKKARLLCSGAWNQPGTQRLSSPPVELNGQGGGLQNGTLEGSPHGGESTLLASLLQSFSSRLQSVAMSQQGNKPAASERSPPPPAPAQAPSPSADKEALPCYGTASSRLKGLMRKSKLQSHNATPYSRRGPAQERPSESPRSTHGATPPSGPAGGGSDAVSCAERLKAVANLVKIRSSPAPSPKPSVACSQLALLLSSEAHLQQYSREHALKAQISGRSASERLAAMATQQGQDKRPSSAGDAEPPGALNAPNGTAPAATALPPPAANSSQQSPSLLAPPGSPRPTPPPPPSHAHPPARSHGQPPREKRGLDSRPARPPQTCSSLLLLLLNNHNNQKQLTKNGHLEDDLGALPPSRGSGCSSVTSDSECSTQERSLAKESSDAESSYSSCSPIDLSVRGRAGAAETGPKSFSFSSASSSAVFSSAFSPSPRGLSTPAFSACSAALSSSTAFSSSSSSSSLDKLTESLINKWKPDPSGPTRVHQARELEKSPDLKSHPKVTLMQLLLERRNNDKGNKTAANPDLQHDATPSLGMPRGPPRGPSPWDEGRTHSPLDRPGPLPPPLPLYTLSREPGSTPSPYSYPSPHVQSSPLDLCKSKPYPSEKAPEPAFSASKLLQNLAQCGTASPSPPTPPGKAPSQELDAGRPLALLERLNAPAPRNDATPLSDGPSGSGAPFRRREASSPPAASSQIENLLERRTVLQLLLGTGAPCAAAASGRRDRPSGGGGRRSAEGPCFDKPGGASVICDSSNGAAAVADVKVKAEPSEEVSVSSAPPNEAPGRKRRSAVERQRSPFSEAQPDLKIEPRPAEVIAKYGLLSQLLKQQTATYYTASAQTETRLAHVKEEQKEHLGSGPKKRRLCPELAESLSNGSPHRPADGLMSAVKEGPDLRGLRSPKEEERPARSPQGGALPRESRGFNVLKQLLLSDNCLKELSQHSRGAPSPSSLLQVNGKANGGVLNQPGGYNHQLLHLPWHQHAPPLSSGPPPLPSHLRPLLTPPTGDGSHRGLPWGHPAAPLQDSPKRDAPPPVKREAESPVRWGGREEGEGEEEEEEETCDSSPDSPRLTRSNPILYYMLQKGSAQLRREMTRDQGEGPPGAGVRVKEEPVADMHAYDRRQNSSQHSPPHNDKHSHRSQGLSQSSDKW